MKPMSVTEAGKAQYQAQRELNSAALAYYYMSRTDGDDTPSVKGELQRLRQAIEAWLRASEEMSRALDIPE